MGSKIDCPLPPPGGPPCNIFVFFKLYALKSQNWKNYCSKRGKKCHVTLWLTPSLPCVLFGDIIATPLECHVLFEWPLINATIKICRHNEELECGNRRLVDKENQGYIVLPRCYNNSFIYFYFQNQILCEVDLLRYSLSMKLNRFESNSIILQSS